MWHQSVLIADYIIIFDVNRHEILELDVTPLSIGVNLRLPELPNQKAWRVWICLIANEIDDCINAITDKECC